MSYLSNIILRQHLCPYIFKNLDEKYSVILDSYNYLSERYGAFDYDEQFYRTKFAEIILQAMKLYNMPLYTKNKPVYLYYNNIRYYKDTIKDVDLSVLSEYQNKTLNSKKFDVQCFITFEDDVLDVYTISSKLTPDEMNTYNLKSCGSLYNETSNKRTVSIVLSLTAAYLKYSPDYIASIAMHELTHIINSLNFKLDDNVKVANAISSIFLDPQNSNILPSCNHVVDLYNYLKTLNWHITNKGQLYMFIAICVYYCDKSERAAYMNNFIYDCNDISPLNKQNLLRPLDKTEYHINKLKIKYSESYTIYFLLFDICQRLLSTNKFIKFDVSKDTLILELFKYYDVKSHLNDIATNQILIKCPDIHAYVELWLRAVMKWLRRAENIIKDKNGK